MWAMADRYRLVDGCKNRQVNNAAQSSLLRRVADRIGAGRATRSGDTGTVTAEGVPAVPPCRPGGWWDLLPFTTHRIKLVSGVETMVGGVDVGDDVRCDLVIEACGGSLADRSIVDLGCLEGGFTLAFAARGALHALGIEARDVSVRRCELARNLLGLENAEFVRADIKDELDRRQAFDVVFATGILYHVSDPASVLSSMHRACSSLALIDTHVATRDTVTHDCSDEEVTRHLGGHDYQGRMYHEYIPTVDDAEHENLLWAAWSDADSFWPYEDDLVEMIYRSGFSSVEKVDMSAAGRTDRWGVDPINRVLYLARV